MSGIDLRIGGNAKNGWDEVVCVLVKSIVSRLRIIKSPIEWILINKDWSLGIVF